MTEVRVSGLFVYPIKGCGGSALAEAEVTDRGLANDRRWMVVDRQGGFLSQRTHPRLAAVAVEVGEDSLEVRAPDVPELTVRFGSDRRRPRTVTIWDDTVNAVSEGAEAAAWFTRLLGLECELVRMPDSTRRQVDPARARRGDLVSFADAYPFLLVSEGSLADLNRRLATPVPMDRFRPNVVVDGCRPYAEDGWRSLNVAGVTFRVVKPCARCVVTTVDQRTGERGEEPLRTLSTYRRRGSKVLFGQNLVHHGRGRLRVGDLCEVRSA